MILPRVVPMTPADLDEVMLLERQCFKDPWTRHMYLSDLTRNELATYLVLRLPAEMRGEHGTTLPSLLAYGGFWLLLDEAHIATIASHPDYRSHGLGAWLLLELLDEAVRRGAACSTLEVRVGNGPAHRLYQRLGYQVVGGRVNYYRDGEDALIMTTPPLLEPAMRQRVEEVRSNTSARLDRWLAQSPRDA
jgi:[ribosomal protein S18]-alanine N-acetyltransferase